MCRYPRGRSKSGLTMADFAPFETQDARGEELPDARRFATFRSALRAAPSPVMTGSSRSSAEISRARSADLDSGEALGERERHAAGVAALGNARSCIKLNGGLGTSMGMTRAKSLLPVIRPGLSFLDVTARQIAEVLAEQSRRPSVPLAIDEQFSHARGFEWRLLPGTKRACRRRLRAGLSPAQASPGSSRADLTPARMARLNPRTSGVRPGTATSITALVTSSGMLEGIDRRRPYAYAFVSNSDNLGAVLDLGLLGWFAESGAPFAMEVKERRGEADRKGGHLARLAARPG